MKLGRQMRVGQKDSRGKFMSASVGDIFFCDARK